MAPLLKKAKRMGRCVKKKVTIKPFEFSNRPGIAESVCCNWKGASCEVFLLVLTVGLLAALYLDQIGNKPSLLANPFGPSNGFGRALLQKLGLKNHAVEAPSERLDWVLLDSYPMKQNETARMLEHIARLEDGNPCYRVATHRAQVLGLPSPVGENPVEFEAGSTHFLTIISYDKDGEGRCAGGDFFEIDLSSNHWKSRPPVTDFGNGSYQVMLQVDPEFIGLFMLTIYLSFSNFQGLYWIPLYQQHPDYKGIEIIKMQINFIRPPSPSSLPSPPPPHRSPARPELPKCSSAKGDFKLQQWAGRWTRTNFNEPCLIEPDGRYKCLDLDAQCDGPWCLGPLGRLESNGWVYSAHCSFRIFTREEAWNCLNGKYIFSWGDSNHQDTLRNLLRFVLGCSSSPKRLPRIFDDVYRRGDCRGYHSNLTSHEDELRELLPQTQAQSVRIANIFNGHYLEGMNDLGLWSLTFDDFRETIERKVLGDKEHVPDILILNSGIHDACFWKKPMEFVNVGLDLAMKMWGKILDGVQPHTPLVIYRHSIASAGANRGTVMNPSKLELYTRAFGESFAELNLTKFRIVDDFDMTFPRHYDYAFSDGLHYGRVPEKSTWVDGSIGHQYFVDLMLVHVHLNVICPIS